MRSTIYGMGILISGVVGCQMHNTTPESQSDAATMEQQRADAPTNATDPGLDTQPTYDQTVAGQTASAERVNATETPEIEAKAEIQAAPGTQIDGEAQLTQNGHGVTILVSVKDAPVGEKGIHIHEKGDCSNIPGKSMGGHFAPSGHKHGLPGSTGEAIHLGDLGNIEIAENGTGSKEITVEKANLKEGDPMSLLGKALVIHESNDKGASEQPSGASGSPIACAVIQKK